MAAPKSALCGGDIVRLKSGGPRMTIETINYIGGHPATATCIWFTKVSADKEERIHGVEDTWPEWHKLDFVLDNLTLAEEE